jgi:hypothetical protein
MSCRKLSIVADLFGYSDERIWGLVTYEDKLSLLRVSGFWGKTDGQLNKSTFRCVGVAEMLHLEFESAHPYGVVGHATGLGVGPWYPPSTLGGDRA